MIPDSICNKIRSAVKDYSFKGDRTLEYVGIESGTDGNISCRVYRCSKNSFDINNTEIPPKIKEFNAKILNENSNLEFVDYSYRENDCYSLSYNYRTTEEAYANDPYINEIAAIIRHFVGSSENPYFQTGFLLNSDGQIIEQKYYFNLFQGNNLSGAAKIGFVQSSRDKVIRMMSEIFQDADQELIGDILSRSLEKSYCPFMLGVNKRDDKIELKQYYILSRIMKRKEANNNFLDFIRDYIPDERIGSIVDVCNESLLYLRGYGVSFGQGFCRWRLYFYPLKY